SAARRAAALAEPGAVLLHAPLLRGGGAPRAARVLVAALGGAPAHLGAGVRVVRDLERDGARDDLGEREPLRPAVAPRVGDRAPLELPREQLLEPAPRGGGVAPRRNDEAVRAARHLARDAAHDVDRDEDPEIARGGGVVLPVARRLEDR